MISSAYLGMLSGQFKEVYADKNKDQESDIQKQIKQIARINEAYPMLNNDLGIECLAQAYKEHIGAVGYFWFVGSIYDHDEIIANTALLELNKRVTVEFAGLIQDLPRLELEVLNNTKLERS